MKNIYGVTRLELEEFLISNEFKKFNASQIYEWIYQKKIENFDLMSNLSLNLREILKQNYTFNKLEVIDHLSDKMADKFLFRLSDNEKIEAVLMHHDYGYSLCISTQVGCNMGCAFCESGRLKKVRNLEKEEMVLQILEVEEILNLKITHVVLMGIGEPFDNYDNVIGFIDIINDPKSIALGSRHITVSTSGLIPAIKKFTEYDKQVNLAISLHAPNDELRSKLMPINKAYPLSELMPVLKEYIKKTNRRLTFEYIMLYGVNDTEECAKELAKLVRGMNAYINLIPYNETSHIEFKKSTQERIMKFYDILKKENVCVTIRKEFGSKLKAACGQLRSIYEEG
ncbi:MAG: 23S rRNA (adenine(2503)-C(2))-methyltransferase RlmN [Bacilli bacterium]|nr:23S rRNA (adenine(2503)-C(2))-methyltransferase RlmN [Bacilli bacterium]